MIGHLRTQLIFGAIALLVIVLAVNVAAASAQEDEPEIVYQNIEDGQTLEEPAFVIQFCFAEPVNIKDLFAGGDFAFTLTGPDGLGYGHRDVFQPDAYGVAVYPGPGLPDSQTEGEWKFTYRLTSPDGEQELEGEFAYTVDPDGDPTPSETPPSCVAEGGTPAPTEPGASPTPTPTIVFTTVAPGASGQTSAPGASGEPEPSGSGSANVDGEDDDGDPGILTLALLTIGAAGAVGVVLLVGYLVRRRIGFDPHKPGSDSHDDH